MSAPVDELVDLWQTYGSAAILGGLVLVAVLLVGALFYAWYRRRVDRWVATAANFAVLALSAEGMWVVARERLHLPVALALSVFFVAEAAMVSSSLHARRFYAEHGHPGKHGRAVWVIAAAAGLIVAANATSTVEALLRLALPLTAAYLWWNALTADGTTRPAGSWRWTPRRLLLWLGAIEPGERDAVEINRERQIAAMTTTARRVHRGGRLAAWHEGRLSRLAMAADPRMVAEVRARVDRAARIKELTAPGTGTAQAEQVESYVRELCALVREQSRQAAEHRWGNRIVATPLPMYVPFLTGQSAQVHRADTPEQGEPEPDVVDEEPAGPRTDAELLAELRALDLNLSTLTRYRVEKLTGAASRQAQRLLDAMLAGLAQTAQTTEPARANGHPVPNLVTSREDR